MGRYHGDNALVCACGIDGTEVVVVRKQNSESSSQYCTQHAITYCLVSTKMESRRSRGFSFVLWRWCSIVGSFGHDSPHAGAEDNYLAMLFSQN